MKTKIIAVRHGETEWNYAKLQQEHLDSPLTENGINQAHSLAKGLELGYVAEIENEIVHIIYLTTTSPLLGTAYCQYRIECTKPM